MAAYCESCRAEALKIVKKENQSTFLHAHEVSLSMFLGANVTRLPRICLVPSMLVRVRLKNISLENYGSYKLQLCNKPLSTFLFICRVES